MVREWTAEERGDTPMLASQVVVVSSERVISRKITRLSQTVLFEDFAKSSDFLFQGSQSVASLRCLPSPDRAR